MDLQGERDSLRLEGLGLPAYATASWVSNPITTPGSTTLRVRTSGWTPRGTFTLRITGTSGALSHQGRDRAGALIAALIPTT